MKKPFFYELNLNSFFFLKEKIYLIKLNLDFVFQNVLNNTTQHSVFVVVSIEIMNKMMRKVKIICLIFIA